MPSILILAATKPEISGLIKYFRTPLDTFFKYNKSQIFMTATGVGSVNAALKTGILLSKYQFSQVFMFGCCGSYHNNIATGDVIMATGEINGDLGVGYADTWQDPKNFPFAFINKQNKSYINQYPCNSFDYRKFKVDYNIHTGVLLTVSTVSGDKNYAAQLKNRFDAIAENMEGAASAQVCVYFDVPFTEIRGISNIAGDRNKNNWNIELACCNSQDLLIKLLSE